jgi:hypothetical protein
MYKREVQNFLDMHFNKEQIKKLKIDLSKLSEYHSTKITEFSENIPSIKSQINNLNSYINDSITNKKFNKVINEKDKQNIINLLLDLKNEYSNNNNNVDIKD